MSMTGDPKGATRPMQVPTYFESDTSDTRDCTGGGGVPPLKTWKPQSPTARERQERVDLRFAPTALVAVWRFTPYLASLAGASLRRSLRSGAVSPYGFF